jgi:hypothetical protein
MGTSLVSRLRTLSRVRLPWLIERVLQQLPWSARVQRLSTRALTRVAARFPIVAELIGLHGDPAERPVAPIHHGTSFVDPEADATRDAATDTAGAANAWLAQLANDPSWQIRANAASRLASVQAPGVVDALLAAARDPSAEVAAAAIVALGGKRDARVEPVLRQVLANQEGYFLPVTRAAAVQALAHHLPDGELAPVLDATRDMDAEVSLVAIAALAECAPRAASDPLLRILRDRTGYFLPLVRLGAANALERAGALGQELATQLLQQEPDPAVRDVLEHAALTSVRA